MASWDHRKLEAGTSEGLRPGSDAGDGPPRGAPPPAGGRRASPGTSPGRAGPEQPSCRRAAAGAGCEAHDRPRSPRPPRRPRRGSASTPSGEWPAGSPWPPSSPTPSSGCGPWRAAWARWSRACCPPRCSSPPAARVALACGTAIPEGRLNPLPILGIAAAVPGFALLIAGFWEDFGADAVWQTGATLVALAVYAAFASLLSAVHLQGRYRRLLPTAYTLAAAGGAFLVAVFWGFSPGDGWRLFGIVVVLLVRRHPGGPDRLPPAPHPRGPAPGALLPLLRGRGGHRPSHRVPGVRPPLPGRPPLSRGQRPARRSRNQAMSAACPPSSSGVSTTIGAAAAAATPASRSERDEAPAQVGVTVPAAPRRVAGVVAVQQLQAAGDGPHPVHRRLQVLAGGPGVAGVQAHARPPDGRWPPRAGPGAPGRGTPRSPRRRCSRGGRGRAASTASSALRQRSTPTAGSSSSPTCPACTTTPAAPTAAAASRVSARMLRDGMRTRLLGEATLIR